MSDYTLVWQVLYQTSTGCISLRVYRTEEGAKKYIRDQKEARTDFTASYLIDPIVVFDE